LEKQVVEVSSPPRTSSVLKAQKAPYLGLTSKARFTRLLLGNISLLEISDIESFIGEWEKFT